MGDLIKSKEKIDEVSKSIGNLDKALTGISEKLNIQLDFNLDAVSSTIDSFNTLDTVLSSAVKGFSQLGQFNDKINDMAGAGSMLAQAYNMANNALLGGITNMNLYTVATTISKTITDAFSISLQFLKANPLMAVIGALGLAVGALALFSSFESDAEKETRLFTEAQEAKRKELDAITQVINDSISASLKKSEDIEAESLALRGSNR